MKKNAQRPVFTSDSARKAQPLAVAKRRATDRQLRLDLAHLLGAMSTRLRCELVDLLPIKQVERLRLAMQEAES